MSFADPNSSGNAGTSTTRGQKVSSDDYTSESTGPVASDSLAADSYRQGGGFSENRDSAPSGTAGSSSTWNNTDTSGASELSGATSASARDDGGSGYQTQGSGQSLGTYGGGSAGSSGAGGNNSSYADRDTTGGYSGSGADTYGESGSGGSSADKAPNYTLNQQGTFQGSKAKGENLTEGGFEGEGSNYGSGIGTRDDPGRAAVQGFAKRNASATGPSGYGKAGGDGAYGKLERDESA